MAPLGPDMLAAVLGELLDEDERAEVERGRSIDARAAVLGYCARIDVGVSGPAVTLRSAPAPAARKEARAPVPSPATPPAEREVSPSGSLARTSGRWAATWTASPPVCARRCARAPT
jgi:hypothetical protein